MKSPGSAGIESNRTTLAEFIETKLEPGAAAGENIREIENMEKTLDFMDETVRDDPIDQR